MFNTFSEISNMTFTIALKKINGEYRNPSGDFHTVPAAILATGTAGDCVQFGQNALSATACDTPSYFVCENM
jgi:hypothetical protein